MSSISKSLLLFFSILSIDLYSQDLNGEWVGKIFSTYGHPGQDTINVTLKLSVDKKGIIRGYSTCFFNKTLFAEATLEGKINNTQKEFFIEEKRITNSGGGNLTALLLQRYELKFSDHDSKKLSGKCICIRPVDADNNTPCHEQMQIIVERLNPNKMHS